MVRGQHLLPATRYSDCEARATLTLAPHAEHRLALQVVAGGTLEVTLAQFWSSFGPGRLRVEVGPTRAPRLSPASPLSCNMPSPTQVRSPFAEGRAQRRGGQDRC